MWGPVLVCLLLAWVCLVNPVLRKWCFQYLQSLDPIKDNFTVLTYLGHVEFPLIQAKALEFALFCTYAIPTISKLLVQTGEFRRDCARRYADTDLILCECTEHHWSSPRGSEALRRLNHIHGSYPIHNDDMIYTLSVFVLEPARWAARWGQRAYTEREKEAVFSYWRQIGHAMDIQGIPASYAALDEWNQRFEAEHMVFAESNAQVAHDTFALFLSDFPSALHGAVLTVGTTLMDARLRGAMGYRDPPGWACTLVASVLNLRKWVVGYLLPPRPFWLRAQRTKPTKQTYCPSMQLHANYPHLAGGAKLVHAARKDGYRISELGPPGFRPGVAELGNGSGKLYKHNHRKPQQVAAAS